MLNRRKSDGNSSERKSASRMQTPKKRKDSTATTVNASSEFASIARFDPSEPSSNLNKHKIHQKIMENQKGKALQKLYQNNEF